MGGKVWSEEEERMFWTEIIPSSKKRHLFSRPNHDAHGWESLRQVMQERMGDLARRKYTALMLYEHFFQNCVLERFSPNAARFVRAYIAGLTTGQAPIQRSRSVQNSARRSGANGKYSDYGSGSADPPRPNTLRLSEARAVASAAAATQPFREEQTGQHRSEHRNEASAGQRTTQPQLNGTTSEVVNSGADTNGNSDADAERDLDFGERLGPSIPRTQSPLPPFTSLGYPSLFAADSVQLSLPPISAIMALPLLQPSPVPHVPPPTLSTAPLRLARVPLPDNFWEMQQQLVPPPETTTSYLLSLARSRQRRAMSREGHSYSPYPPRPANSTDYGTAGAALQMYSPGAVPSSPVNPLAAKHGQMSTLQEIKAEEEADDLFVRQ